MLGLIARADARGLGVQTRAFHDQMGPAKTLVVDCHSAMPLRKHHDWYPGAQWTFPDTLPTERDFVQFLDGLTAVYTAETGYNPLLWDMCEQRGIRTVLAANWEFLNPRDRPTVWAAPSLWQFDQWPAGAIHLPVPIETERFPQQEPAATAARFLHVVGRPAVHDRNGTTDLLQALQYVTTSITVTITCQQSGHVGGLINTHGYAIPPNITLDIRSTDTDNYWDNYLGQDALILPRRFGGLCLPANEALGAGLPVIMPNISPNNLWLPEEWLVRAEYAGDFRAHQHITYYRTDPVALARKIDQLATDTDFYQAAVTKSHRLRNHLSWNTLRPKYEEVLA